MVSPGLIHTGENRATKQKPISEHINLYVYFFFPEIYREEASYLHQSQASRGSGADGELLRLKCVPEEGGGKYNIKKLSVPESKCFAISHGPSALTHDATAQADPKILSDLCLQTPVSRGTPHPATAPGGGGGTEAQSTQGTCSTVESQAAF